MTHSPSQRDASRRLLAEVRSPRLDRSRFEHAIASCARALLSPGESLTVALRVLIATTSADGAFVERVVENSSYGPCAVTVAEVFRSGVEPGHPFSWQDPETGETVPNGFPYLLTPTLYGTLAAGKAASIVTQRLGEGAEKELFVDMGVVEQYSVPFQIDGRWAGSLGLRRSGKSRRWPSHDMELLRVAAQLFGAAIERSLVNERMNALVRAKDDLIAGVAHRLRTPLTGLVGMTAILRSGEQLEPG